MDSTIAVHVDAPVRYLLTSRLSTEGKISITLQLYRGEIIASTSPVATVERLQAADVMFKCRQRLVRLGVESMPYGKPSRVFFRSDTKPPDPLPPATRLTVRSEA